MGLRIALLGPPVIEVDGLPLAVDTRKAVALLAYLAVTARPHRREELADLLWPQLDPERGRATLRRTLSTLRAALGDRWLRTDQGLIGLDGEGVEVDVARFRAAIAAASNARDPVPSLAEAARLYRDDLLVGFGLRDSVDFDDWQQAAAGELRRELEQALDRLVLALGAVGQVGDAIPHAQRRLLLDPLFEPGHRALIGLLAASGRRAEAIIQYRDCVRLLDRELGVRPLPATTAVYDAVSEGLPVPWPAATIEPPVVAADVDLPLVGREAATRRLLGAYGAAAVSGRVAVVEGEAGIGKSRLLDDLAGAVATEGGRIARARAFDGEVALPFGLVAALLRSALDGAPASLLAAMGDPLRAEAARIVPELAPAAGPASGSGPGAEQRLLQGIADVLAGLVSGGKPGLVVADDLQHADASSLVALAYLARRLAGQGLLLALAWRSEDGGPEHARLRRLADPALRLERLDRGAVTDLARAVGLEDHAERILEETGGLPLFVVEYLRALAAGADPAVQPGGIRELLEARVDDASEAAGQLLAAAAAIGRSFDVDLLRVASGRSDDETVDGVEELLRRGLVTEREGAYAFAHDRLRDVVRERTSLARSRLLNRRIAEALATRRADSAVIAGHLLAAGLEGQAADAYREAGDRARSLGATGEAREAYERALALGHSERAGLLGALGDVLTLQGDYAAAIASYEAATAGAGTGELASLEHRIGRVHERRGDAELALRHLDEAHRLDGPSARLEADRSLALRRAGRGVEALACARSALDLAERTEDAEALAQALNLVGMLTGDVPALERSVALAVGFPDPSVLVAALNNLALAVASGGDRVRAVELTTRALAHCVEQGDRHREAALHNNLADLHHALGQEEPAMAHLKQAVALFAEVGRSDGELAAGVWQLVDW